MLSSRNRKVLPQAVWSHRIGLFAIPVLVISALGFRFEMIGVPLIYVLMAFAWALALLAVVLAAWAFARIWDDDIAGFGRALRGLLLSLLALAFPLFALWPILTYPQLTDIATDPRMPLQFERATIERPPNANPLPPRYSAEHIDAQLAAYPEVMSRRFDVEAAHLFAAVRYVVIQERWEVSRSTEPIDADGVGGIEAIDRSLIMRFPSDIVIRTGPDPLGSRLDMRSASRYGRHDLGVNAARIREFVDAVDEALLVAPLDYDPAGV